MQGQLVAGRYRLTDSIGSGGMGRVWRAHDEVLHRKVAVKELTAALYVSESDQHILLARTRAEARAAARINHSAVVTVHDVLEHDGRPWIVMELVEGESLADAVKERGRIEPREAARIGLWVLRALRAAHTAGVLHRDVKPGNVLLGRDGRVLLTDFGIAQIEGDSTITRTGEVVGSVDYLAPERIRGHDPGPASDLWALGATLYTAVEGRSPFRRTSPLGTMQAVVEEDAENPHNAGPLAPVITALLHKNPSHRPDAHAAERMLADAAEGRLPDTATVSTPPPAPAPYSAVATSGATAVTPLAPTAAPVPARRGRRTRTLALVAAAVLVFGASLAVGYLQWGGGHHAAVKGDDTGSPSASASASASDSASAMADPGPAGTGTVPDSWERHDDPLGFSLSLPKGWTRKVYGISGDLKQIDYTPDNGVHFVRIAVDTSPDFADVRQHQEDLEEQLQRLVDYRRVRMEGNTYRDREGSLWEYTWTALARDAPYVAGPRRAVEEAYISREGTEYVIYMSSPAEDWGTADRQFRWVLQSWHPRAG
ncbi:serine/threonine-protein kinase [Streptomyces sp. BV129]|uniref:serine/threonine-protein kinase n=1 Tax=Streptomyces sp. BV129 TaxID=2849671 RepID=UPI001C2F0DD2|nr:serine/threonine-protein kinase [Streptomyces sp. BV129]MBV1946486.1 serine/threonine protein kinase [Streptomyces sp. BV129]